MSMKNKFIFITLITLNIFFIFNLIKYFTVHAFLNKPNPKNTIIDYQIPGKPIVNNKDSFPKLNSEAYILIDTATNTILAQKNSDKQIYPASTTKLATALTALNIYPLDEIITIPSIYTEGKTMDLIAGEKITVRSLVEALLVYSANDAAYNLAYHHQQGVEGFIKDMNNLLKKYNINNTNFTNYDGIHNFNHYSTVYDLSQLGRLAIKNPVITEIVPQKKITVYDVDKKIEHKLISTNELLDLVPEIKGLKTGWTPEAGGCFISLLDINGYQLIGVVAQSTDRFEDTKKMIEWAKNSVI